MDKKRNTAKVTIYDVAKEVHVSPATVSRVLNHSTHPVKEAVRNQILETAKQMGYVPNFQARSLKTRTSSAIGVMVPSIDNPFYPTILRGMEDEASKHNCHLIIFSFDRNKDRIKFGLDNLMAVNVQGIISIFMDYIPQSMKNYAARGENVLRVVANGHTMSDMYTITVDKIREGRLATDFLIANGHRKVGVLFDSIDNSIRQKRIEGLLESFHKIGITYDSKYILQFDQEEYDEVKDYDFTAKGYHLAERMLREIPDVTAVMCMNDSMALGALKCFTDHGKRVPEDFSLISFDDLVFASALQPSLTTVGLDKYRWGKQLIQYYFQIVGKGDSVTALAQEDQVLNCSELIVRESVRSKGF